MEEVIKPMTDEEGMSVSAINRGGQPLGERVAVAPHAPTRTFNRQNGGGTGR
jgi:hypothetical protein